MGTVKFLAPSLYLTWGPSVVGAVVAMQLKPNIWLFLHYNISKYKVIKPRFATYLQDHNIFRWVTQQENSFYSTPLLHLLINNVLPSL